MKNPQTTIAPTFLTHIISAIGGVMGMLANKKHPPTPLIIHASL